MILLKTLKMSFPCYILKAENKMGTLSGKHIVLGITGGIAAYKSVTLLRLLVKAGAEVQVVITPSGKEFITPVTLAALSGKPVVSEFFSANTGEWHSHVDLGLWADLMVIAPATASTIGKMANGIADNMLVTTYLSAKEHVMIAPAMDLDMMSHPSTVRNLKTLKEDGVEIIESASGELASHLVGKGRMEEPERIFDRVVAFFNKKKDLTGKKVVITAGPTYEKIDPVRFIGNYSTGKMGFAIAVECAERGADVVLVAGPVNITVSHPNIQRIDVGNAREMLAAVGTVAAKSDIAVFSAAVADYRPQSYSDSKIKREGIDDMELRLIKNPDIAAAIGKIKKAGQILVGFALETDNERENALRKMRNKNLDFVVLNSLNDKGACFGTDTNKITILDAGGGERNFELKDKRLVAKDIIDAVVSVLE